MAPLDWFKKEMPFRGLFGMGGGAVGGAFAGGVKGMAITGGTVVDDGDWRMHFFTSTGPMEVKDLPAGEVGIKLDDPIGQAVHYVAVGGGGGAGNDMGGGGGGGGVVYSDGPAPNGPAWPIDYGAFTVTIGAGGGNSYNGGDTTVNFPQEIRAYGGGGGGNRGSHGPRWGNMGNCGDPGRSGGSGGGGAAGGSPGGAAVPNSYLAHNPSPTTRQGGAGHKGIPGPNDQGGGGGAYSSPNNTQGRPTPCQPFEYPYVPGPLGGDLRANTPSGGDAYNGVQIPWMPPDYGRAPRHNGPTPSPPTNNGWPVPTNSAGYFAGGGGGAAGGSCPQSRSCGGSGGGGTGRNPATGGGVSAYVNTGGGGGAARASGASGFFCIRYKKWTIE